MLANNIKILKKRFSKTYTSVSSVEPHYKIIPSKSGEPTLVINQNEKMISYHSRYNPIDEAEKFIESINELNNVNHVLLIGVGLGYHIKGILRKYPNMQFSIFEPNLQVLHAFLNFFDLSEIKEKNLINVFHSLEDIVNIEKLLRLVIKSSTMA
ncbi:motility associated factor glycosyltransferase family protein, partial [Lysinibacillus mangiferihumi]